VLRFTVENEWDLSSPAASVSRLLQQAQTTSQAQVGVHPHMGVMSAFSAELGRAAEWALDNRFRYTHNNSGDSADRCAGDASGEVCSATPVTASRRTHNGDAQAVKPHTSGSYVVAKEKGMLHLSPESVQAHGFRTHTLTLSAQDDCFGPPAYVWLLEVRSPNNPYLRLRAAPGIRLSI
jgi:hypothetical protein